MRDPLPANANSRHTGKLESHGVRTLGRVIPYRQDADGGILTDLSPPAASVRRAVLVPPTVLADAIYAVQVPAIVRARIQEDVGVIALLPGRHDVAVPSRVPVQRGIFG